MVSELVKSYTAYRTKREKIKARQRKELEAELMPEAISIGAAFVREQEKGRSVVEIAGSLGLKNRTFLYQMKALYKASEHPSTAPESPEPTEVSPGPEVTYEAGGHGLVYVTINDFDGFTTYSVDVDDKGRVTSTPDEWATHTKERRQLYKQIVQEINNGEIP